MICTNCNNSEKESFLLLKGNKIKNNNNCLKEDNKKEQLITTSDDNNNSTNNLEIIDYPYSINFNQDETFQINANDLNIGIENNYEILNSEMKKENFIEDGFKENNYASRNINRITLNNSSGIINNEDSITQNKILLQNLYSNYNKNINNNENINENNKVYKVDNDTKDSNIEKKNEKNNIKNKKLYNIEKNNITYKIHHNIDGIKVEYPVPDTENFISKSNNLISSKLTKADAQTNNEKKIKINLKKYQKSSINQTKDLNNNIKKKNININIKNTRNAKKIKVNNKNNLPSEFDSKNKEKILNTFKLYTNNKISNSLKQKKTKAINNNSKLKTITVSRKTTVKNIKKYKPYLCFKLTNMTINTSAPITKKNRMMSYQENYKKLLLNKFNLSNYNCRNTVLDYSEKNFKYTNLMSLRKRRNEECVLISKTYLNPFDIVQKKIVPSSSSKIKIRVSLSK